MDFTQFCIDWNNGKEAKDLAEQYGVSVSTVRNWVNVLRKKGVNLEKRVRSHIDIDVVELNKALSRAANTRASK